MMQYTDFPDCPVGSGFITNVPILARASALHEPEQTPAALTRLVCVSLHRGYPPYIIANLLLAGRFAEMVECLMEDRLLHGSGYELDMLLEAAADFALPERFIREPERLLAHVRVIAGRR